MSLITRCPACETMFKVVPDQLRISEGWVRCGQCGEIFNASQNLVAADAAPPTTPDIPPPAAPQNSPATAFADTRVPMEDAPSGMTNPWPVAPATPDAPNTQPDTRRGEFEQKVWDLQPSPEEVDAPEDRPPAAAETATPSAPPMDALPPMQVEPAWSDPAPVATEPEPDTADAVVALAAAARSAPDDDMARAPDDPPAPEDAPATVSFLQQDAAAGFWSRRPVRLALAVLAVLLAALLLGQVLVQERNRIAQVEPATRPVLQALCAIARCEIGPLRQIESVVIDSSSFGRLRADGYRLGFSLRNQAPIDIAMPAIELSLTDTQDQALIRRVILPTEFGAPSNVLAAGADWSGTLALSIRPGTPGERIAGYRLLAFYP